MGRGASAWNFCQPNGKPGVLDEVQAGWKLLDLDTAYNLVQSLVRANKSITSTAIVTIHHRLGSTLRSV